MEMRRGGKVKMRSLASITTALLQSNSLRKEAWLWISTSFSLLISILSIIDDCAVRAILMSLVFSMIVLIVFLSRKYIGYTNEGKHIKSGTTKINVKFGNLYEEEGVKLIPCEEGLQRKESLSIPERSIQAQYFKNSPKSRISKG